MKQNTPPRGKGGRGLGPRMVGGKSLEMVERAGFVVFYLTFPMTWPVVSLGQGPCSGSGVPGWRRSLGVQIAQPAAAQRWRDEDSGGGRRESGGGGSLKGPRRGRGTVSEVPSLCLSSSHPGIQAPSLGSLGVVMETGRQARPGEAGGTKGKKEGGRTL